MDKKKRLKYIKEMKKLSDEDFYLLDSHNKFKQDMIFWIVFLYAIFQVPIMVVINVIDHGTTIFHLPVSWSAFFFFSYFTIVTEIRILALIIVFLICYNLCNKNYPKIKELRNKLKQKIEPDKK